MAAKFIVFVVFVGFAQCSFVQSADYYANAELQFERYTEYANILFNALQSRVDDFERALNEAQTEATKELVAGHDVVLVTVKDLHPDATTEIAYAEEKYPTAATIIVEAFISAMRFALNTSISYEDVLNKTEAGRKETARIFLTLSGAAYDLIRYGQTFAPKIDATLTSNQQEAYDLMNSYAYEIFAMIEDRAKNIRSEDSTDADTSATEGRENDVLSMLEDFTVNLADSAILVREAQATY